ncbi:MAG: OmpA family protein [Candidatus Zixiibacteriota bacterium]
MRFLRIHIVSIIICLFQMLLAMPILVLEASYETDIDNSYKAIGVSLFDEFDFNLTGGIGYIGKFNSDGDYNSLASLKVGYKKSLHKRIAVHPLLDNRYNFSAGDFSFQPSLGISYYITPSFCIDIQGGYNINFEYPTIGIAFDYKLGFKDKDRDWVKDDIDICPNTPKNAKVNKHGCGIDSDGDGVFDGIDICPDTPFRAFVDSLGCPFDSDGDGVFDGVDKCPETPIGIVVDSFGCPADTDGDGVSDFEDSCAATPKGAIVDSKGCPKDTDEDGVYDGIDRCPGTPTGFEVDRFGCPYTMPIDSIVIYDLYDASLNLRGKAVGVLEKIANRIRAYPDRKVVIRIYTDSEGSPRFNYNRALQVSNRVKSFLIERGVDEELLTFEPKGEQSPIASNATSEGIRKNRRMEIIAEQK